MDGNGNQEGAGQAQTAVVTQPTPGHPVTDLATGTVTFASLKERNNAMQMARAKDTGGFEGNIHPNDVSAQAPEARAARQAALQSEFVAPDPQILAEQMMSKATAEGKELMPEQAEDMAKLEAVRMQLEASSGRKVSRDMARAAMNPDGSISIPNGIQAETPQVELKSAPLPWYKSLARRIFGGQQKTSTAS